MTKKSFSMVQNFLMVLVMTVLLTGCGGNQPPIPTFTPPPPEVIIILNPAISDITTGQTVSLVVETSGKNLTFKWSALQGVLSSTDAPSVDFTAPDMPGLYTVTVEVSSDSGTTIKHVSFNVIPVTETPISEATPTSTPTLPGPVPCNNPAITENVFAQLTEVAKQFPFYGPLEEQRFLCEGVFDVIHGGRLAIRLQYDEFGKNFGFWGIGVPTGSPFDISNYQEICFWVYAQKPLQSFKLRMKDVSNSEDGPIIVTKTENMWEQICTPLTEFSDLGIQLNSLENINLGFNSDTHDAEIWVDDFELIE